MDESTRKKAIQRYLSGEKPKAIYTSLNRSKKWFFKWLKRFQTGDANWFKDQSRAPSRMPTKISAILNKQIVEIRKQLESEQYAQIGSSAIKWELTKARSEIPSDRTIHRIIKKEGLVKKNFIYSQRNRISVF